MPFEMDHMQSVHIPQPTNSIRLGAGSFNCPS